MLTRTTAHPPAFERRQFGLLLIKRPSEDESDPTVPSNLDTLHFDAGGGCRTQSTRYVLLPKARVRIARLFIAARRGAIDSVLAAQFERRAWGTFFRASCSIRSRIQRTTSLFWDEAFRLASFAIHRFMSIGRRTINLNELAVSSRFTNLSSQKQCLGNLP